MLVRFSNALWNWTPKFWIPCAQVPNPSRSVPKKNARLSASPSASSRWCCWAFGPPAPRSTGVLLGEEEKHTEAARLAFPGCKGTFGHHSGEASRPIAVEVPYLRRIAILHIFLVRVRLLSGLSLEEGNDWMWGCARNVPRGGLGFEGGFFALFSAEHVPSGNPGRMLVAFGG